MDNTSYESSSGLSYQYDRKGRSKKSKLIRIAIIVTIIIVGIFIGLGVLGAFFGGENEETNTTPTPTPLEFRNTPTPTPDEETEEETEEDEDTTDPSPTPEEDEETGSVDSATGLDRADLSIEIQNGSGITGAASNVSDILEELGYKILSTGNADNFDYEETVIRVKAANEEFLELLEADLSDDYTIGEATADLTDSTADALVIVGQS